MKRSITFFIFLTIWLLLLTGCECKHEWADATCETPKTCSLCSVTEGTATGHDWAFATCEKPKTCSICNATEGVVADHDYSKKVISDEYLCAPATTEHPPQYYQLCRYCEKIGTATFYYGSVAQTTPSTWIRNYYVDKFGDFTNEWYIALRNKTPGTFSNTDSSNSPLYANVLYDYDNRISIFLYENTDDHLVKNPSSTRSELYKISIKNDIGETVDVRGGIPTGADRIFILETDISPVLEMMKTSSYLRFYIESESSPTCKYRFNLELTDFNNALAYASK